MKPGMSTPRDAAQPRMLPAAVAVTIVAIGLAAHGLLLATDHVIWDGWWQFADVDRQDGAAVTMRHLREVGRPLDALYYLPFRLVPSFDARVVGAKAAGLACWILTAICMFLVLHRGGLVATIPALVVAAIAVVLPVFPLLGEYSLWMYTSAVLLFWLGWLLVTLSARRRGAIRLGARVLSMAIFFLSFNLNSLLVMFYGVAAMLAGMRRRHERRPWVTGIAALALANADLLLTPLVFWGWKILYTPSNGSYAGYNRPSFDPARILGGYAGLIRDVLIGGGTELLSSSSWLFCSVIVVAALSLLVGRHRAMVDTVDGNSTAADGAKLASWGLFLLMTAAFPYIVVGQSLVASGWQSRNCILLPLPVAMIVTGLLQWANACFLPGRRHAWLPVACGLVILSVGCLCKNYLALQGFGAKQRSIIARMQDPDREDVAVLQLQDHWHLPGTIDSYPPLIWTYMAARDSTTPKTFVFETVSLFSGPSPDASGSQAAPVPRILVSRPLLEDMIKQTTLSYALEAIPRDGRHQLLVVMPANRSETPTALGARYLEQKWFDPAGMAGFLRDLTTETTVDLGMVANH